MTIKPPAWCVGAVPEMKRGWVDPNSNELLVSSRFTQAQIDEFYGVPSFQTIQDMNQDPIVFALANPNPEIKPELAHKAGAKIVATGRADYPNQINNILVFPGVLKGAIDNRVSTITRKMLVQASINLAKVVTDPTSEKIIPHALDEGVCESIQSAIKS